MILNLTQHPATAEQILAGVVEPQAKSYIQMLITFNEIPTKRLLESRAELITKYVLYEKFTEVMIGGAPYFMPYLEKALKGAGIKCLYAFSKRIIEEEVIDGIPTKKTKFVHEGFFTA